MMIIIIDFLLFSTDHSSGRNTDPHAQVLSAATGMQWNLAGGELHAMYPGVSCLHHLSPLLRFWLVMLWPLTYIMWVRLCMRAGSFKKG